MDAVLLDTDVFSYLLRAGDRRSELYRKHVQGKTVAVSFITVGELYYGASKRDWSPKRVADLEQRLKATVIVPYDIEICKAYGRLRATLKTQSGTDRVIQSNDLWIAACAVRHNLPLVTNNRKHFDGIPDLKVISEASLKPQPEPQSLFPQSNPGNTEPASE